MAGATPSTASAVRRARPRGSFRAVLVSGLVFLTSLGTLLGASPASANSALGIASNAWIVSDLASTAMNTASTLPYDPVLEAELLTAGAATTTTAAKPGVTAKPKPSSKLGLIVNTAAMLGGLVFAWPGGEDAPAVPAPPASDPSYDANYTHRLAGHGFDFARSPWLTSGADAASGQVVLVVTQPPPWPADSSTYGWRFPYEARCRNTSTGALRVTSSSTGQYRKTFPAEVAESVTCAPGEVAHSYRINRPYPYNADESTWTQYVTGPATGGTTDPALVPRYIESTATCKTSDGAGGFTSQTITNKVGPFTFDPATPSELPEVPDLTCPSGSFLEGGTHELVTEGTTERMPLSEPYTAPEWVQEQATRFPECMPIGGQACQLKLFRKATAADPELDCHSVAPGSGNACRDWATDPDKATRYECRYGGNVVALKNCEPYKETFKTGTVQPTPDVETAPPVTGADPTPDATPNLGDCVPSWSTELLNPWWLFKGVACALSWAFVPQTALSVRVDAIKTDLLTKAPFSWFGGFLAVPGAIPDNGCPDWRVKVAGLDKNVVCGHTSTDFIRAARPVLLVFMASLALWPLIRSTAYAAFPIIKPSPGMLR